VEQLRGLWLPHELPFRELDQEHCGWRDMVSVSGPRVGVIVYRLYLALQLSAF